MSDISVKASLLQKRFGDFIAVDSISFEVEKGEIYGFLGANGAGKTTTIRMLCGLLSPTSGDALVAGHSIKNEPEEVKKNLGYMSQKFSLYPLLNVRENISFYAGIYGMDDGFIKARIPEVCAAVGLEGMQERRVGDLPGGLKQRVSLACAIAHKPRIIFLDEPTAGVDPILRRRFWDIIRMLSGKGTTVFVTTHYMDEVEHCDRIALMHSGRIIKEGTIPEIKRSVFLRPILETETDEPARAYEALEAQKEKLGEISMHGALIHVIPKFDAPMSLKIMKSVLDGAGIKFTKPGEVEPTMDDVFVKVVKDYEKGKKLKIAD
jgi:ABC-2 type transport system ATP-binding protein